MSASNRYVFKSKPKEPFILKKIWLKFSNCSTKRVFLWGCVSTVGMALYGLGVYHYAQYRSRSSDYNVAALNSLLKHRKLIEILGEPVKAGYVFARIKGGFDQDHVDLVVPLNGSNADGFLKYQADRVDNEWIIRRMEFTFLGEAGGVVRLLKDERKEETAS